MDTLNWLFSHVCGQQHCWVMGRAVLPLCQRCTGLYVGGAFAVWWIAWLRPCAISSVLWIHGFMMLIMAPFGYHLIAHGASVRTLTGLLFSFGLTYYLVLNPAVRTGAFRTRGSNAPYWAGLVIFVLVVLWAVHLQNENLALVISYLALAGLVTYLSLTIANVIVLSHALWQTIKSASLARAR